MNILNKQHNIQVEWDKAQEALREAEMLCAQQMPGGAISRAYYAAFHAATAMVLTEGLQVRSHQGLGRLFSLHFIKTKILAVEMSRILSKAQKYREEADYSAAYVFTMTDATERLTEVRTFMSHIERYLRAHKYLPAA